MWFFNHLPMASATFGGNAIHMPAGRIDIFAFYTAVHVTRLIGVSCVARGHRQPTRKKSGPINQSEKWLIPPHILHCRPGFRVHMWRGCGWSPLLNIFTSLSPHHELRIKLNKVPVTLCGCCNYFTLVILTMIHPPKKTPFYPGNVHPNFGLVAWRLCMWIRPHKY